MVKIDWMAMEDAANKKVASSDLVKNTNSFIKIWDRVFLLEIQILET